MSLAALLRIVRGVLADRRGITAIALAGSSMGAFGAIALGTEAGVWYSARRELSTAADIAAVRAASTLSRYGETAARTAAFDMARRNGFADGGANSVLVSIPPTSGAFAGNAAAVEVVVRHQQQRTGLAARLIGAGSNVSGRSVATVVEHRDVCILALTGKLSISGSASVDAPNCVLGSNRDGGIGVALGNGAAVLGHGVSAVASCDGCDGGNVMLVERAQARQLPVTNPFAHLDGKALPRFDGINCLDPGRDPAALLPYELNGRRAYCNDISLSGSAVLTLVTGTYYLNNASLTVNGGATITCPTCNGRDGVTIVLTGDASRVGEIDIKGGATIVNLRAPADPADPDFRGVLIYRDAAANTGGTAVEINGDAALGMAGGLYFPSSTVAFTGGSSSSGCIVLVAAAIDLRGNAAATVNGCNATATAVPRTRIAAVVE